MPTFNPPTVDEVSPVLGDRPGIIPGYYTDAGGDNVAFLLFRHYKTRAKGQTVVRYTDGTCVTMPYPYGRELVQPQDAEALATVAADQAEQNPYGIPIKDVAAFYLGGHVYDIGAAEAALLTACGYGAYIT